MFAFLDPPEILLILVVVLVLFGGAQLPKLAKNLGKAQKEFKEGLAEGQKAAEAKSAEKTPAEKTPAEKTSAETAADDAKS